MADLNDLKTGDPVSVTSYCITTTHNQGFPSPLSFGGFPSYSVAPRTSHLQFCWPESQGALGVSYAICWSQRGCGATVKAVLREKRKKQQGFSPCSLHKGPFSHFLCLEAPVFFPCLSYPCHCTTAAQHWDWDQPQHRGERRKNHQEFSTLSPAYKAFFYIFYLEVLVVASGHTGCSGLTASWRKLELPI